MTEPTCSMAELMGATGVTARTLRSWTAAHLLNAPPFRARATRWPAIELARARAIAKLRRDGVSMATIRARVVGATLEQLDAMVPTATSVGQAAAVRAPEPRACASTTWQRVTLLPGLELHVDPSRGEVLLRLAREIVARYGAVA